MHKKLLLFFLLFSIGVVKAQKIKIQESSEMVENISRTGMYVSLELDKKDVEKLWSKYLKAYGKTSSSNGVLLIHAADMKAISSYPCRVFSIVSATATGAKVWWAIDLGAKFVSKESEAEYKGAEKMLYEFAVSAYRDDINKQIEDAEGALLAATKIHEKEVNEGIDLQDKIDNSGVQKVELEDKLKVNKEDYVRLNREIDNNLAEQKVALQNSENIKAVQHAKEGQLQTNEEKKALTDAVKVQKEKVNEGERLAKDLAKNKQNRVDLEAKQKKNAADMVEFLKQKEQNQKDQAAAAIDVEKMKTAVDVVKNKMNTIE